MKVKELIECLQTLDQKLEVYITNIEETQLTEIDVVIPCEDFGENDWGEFVAIFPKEIPDYSNLENLEHRNLSQETANCDKFTLTDEEVILLRNALSDEIFYYDKYSKEKDSARYSEKYMKILNKVTEWLR